MTNLTYKELQAKLRQYKQQGLTSIRLNSSKIRLQEELNRIELKNYNTTTTQSKTKQELISDLALLRQAHQKAVNSGLSNDAVKWQANIDNVLMQLEATRLDETRNNSIKKLEIEKSNALRSVYNFSRLAIHALNHQDKYAHEQYVATANKLQNKIDLIDSLIIDKLNEQKSTAIV